MVDMTLYPDSMLMQAGLLFSIMIAGKFLILDPVMKTVNKRQEKVDGLKSSTEEILKAIEDRKAEYNGKYEALLTEISDYQRTMRQEAAEESAKIIEDAKLEIEKDVEMAMNKLRDELDTAREDLERSVDGLTDSIVSKVIGKA